MNDSNTSTAGLPDPVVVLDLSLLDVPVLDVPVLALYETSIVSHLADDALLAQQSRLAELRRRTETNLAILADEIARRSHHSLGNDGLAQRLGSRTAQHLV